jgi:hypothetical protein
VQALQEATARLLLAGIPGAKEDLLQVRENINIAMHVMLSCIWSLHACQAMDCRFD